MDNNPVLLEKMIDLGVGQRKIVKEQGSLLALQKEVCLSLSELKAGLAELRVELMELQARQAKLKASMHEVQVAVASGALSAAAGPVGGAHGVSQRIWLDACEAKELLLISDITLRRRRNDGSFVAKKIGKKWFYLKSSLQ